MFQIQFLKKTFFKENISLGSDRVNLFVACNASLSLENVHLSDPFSQVCYSGLPDGVYLLTITILTYEYEEDNRAVTIVITPHILRM